MPFTRTSLLRLIKIIAALVIAGIIIGYAIWRSLNYARGPDIVITMPVNGSTVTAATTTVSGRAVRINNLTLNGNPIFIDEAGNFSEVIIVFPGINRLTVVGHDQFERETEVHLEIIGKGTLPRPHTEESIGTSTPEQKISTST